MTRDQCYHAALAGPSTVLLALVLRRERLSFRQWIGMELLFIAVATTVAATG